MILVSKDYIDHPPYQQSNDLELVENPLILEAIISPIDLKEAVIVDFEKFRDSETFLHESEKYFASSKYADKQNEVLRRQLKDMNTIPLEYIPLPELKQEIEILIKKINNNVITEEESKRLDYLVTCLDKNPEYIAEQERELFLWLENSILHYRRDYLIRNVYG